MAILSFSYFNSGKSANEYKLITDLQQLVTFMDGTGEFFSGHQMFT
jgi:hypothetical protein